MRMQKDKVGSKVGRMGIERHPREVREFHLSLELELWSIHQRDLRATSYVDIFLQTPLQFHHLWLWNEALAHWRNACDALDTTE